MSNWKFSTLNFRSVKFKNIPPVVVFIPNIELSLILFVNFTSQLDLHDMPIFILNTMQLGLPETVQVVTY